ncbi:MAG: CRTAC1 family protein [Planctomycetota bacterium]
MDLWRWMDTAAARLLRRARVLAAALPAVLAGTGLAQQPQPTDGEAAPPLLLFEDWTDASGVQRAGQSYGAAWGDIDGDARPDLYLASHNAPEGPALFRNLGDGAFVDVTSERINAELRDLLADRHGASFADLDNDGDLDLMSAVGAHRGVGAGANLVFVNEGGILQLMPTELGLAHPLGRSRMMQALDLNGDGWLDVVCCAVARPDDGVATGVFVQRDADPRFLDVSSQRNLPPGRARYLHELILPKWGLAALVRDWRPRVYPIRRFGVHDLSEQLGLDGIRSIMDSAVADFDGDGDFDFFCARGYDRSEVVRVTPLQAKFAVIAGQYTESLRIKHCDGAGKVHLELYGSALRERIYLGAGGYHPQRKGGVVDATHLTLTKFDARLRGIYAPPGLSQAVSIGFLPETDTWQITQWGPRARLQGFVTLPSPAVEFELENRHPRQPPDGLWLQDDDRFVQARRAGVSGQDSVGVAAGDFDNDMDVDLYVVRTGAVSNLPNYFYENLGSARFRRHTDGAGAPGSSLGRGDAVAAADFDGDGSLDLCVTNGLGEPPFYDDGPVQLYRNRGNSNHWLKVDLVGVRSNRDAIGACITVVAGGKRQVRMVSSGVHGESQDHRCVHFGLGRHRAASHLIVEWPSGARQVLKGVLGDRRVRVREPE